MEIRFYGVRANLYCAFEGTHCVLWIHGFVAAVGNSLWSPVARRIFASERKCGYLSVNTFFISRAM